MIGFKAAGAPNEKVFPLLLAMTAASRHFWVSLPLPLFASLTSATILTFARD